MDSSKSVKVLPAAKLKVVPEGQIASIDFRLPVKYADTSIYLTTRCGKVGAASHSSMIYPSQPIRASIASKGQGRYSAPLSPGVSYDLIIYRGSEHYCVSINLKSGETRDLGTVPIK